MCKKNLIRLFFTCLIFTMAKVAFAENTIYLIRHAEKQSDGTSNPGLTPLGELRAKNIAQFLVDKKVTHIFSTDYQRTLQTAQPSASLLNISIEKYEPAKMAEFSAKLKSLKGNSLVVGHSNTTPYLAYLLGGETFGSIDESEFDRLYQIDLKDGLVSSQLLKSNPEKHWASKKTLSLNPALFQSRQSTFQMTSNGQVIGTSVHILNFAKDEISLHEKTLIEKYLIDADIKVSVNPENLLTKNIKMSGDFGGDLDVKLSWKDNHLEGHSTMNRDEFKTQGTIEINKDLPANTYSRTSILMLAHLLPVAKNEIFSINWYNAEDDELRPIEISYQGEEKIAVPAGEFETYKIKMEGGAPSQMIYISKEKLPRIVKIEVIATSWFYQLLE